MRAPVARTPRRPAIRTGAVGLGQILPGTASGLLGMWVDLEASKRLSAAIERANRRAARSRSTRIRRAAARRATALERRRRAVDERYDARASLEGAARYLATAQRRSRARTSSSPPTTWAWATSSGWSRPSCPRRARRGGCATRSPRTT